MSGPKMDTAPLAALVENAVSRPLNSGDQTAGREVMLRRAVALRVEGAFHDLHAKDDVQAVLEHGRWWVTCTNGEGERETYLVEPITGLTTHPAETSGDLAFLLVPR